MLNNHGKMFSASALGLLGLLAIFPYKIVLGKAVLDPESLRLASQEAQNICRAPEQYGYKKGAQGSISGQLNVGKLASKLITGGADVKVDVGDMTWQGVVQEKIDGALANYQTCVSTVFQVIADKFLYSDGADVKKPSAIIYYPKWAREADFVPTSSRAAEALIQQQNQVIESCGKCMTTGDLSVRVPLSLVNGPGSKAEFDLTNCDTGIRLGLTAHKLKDYGQNQPGLLALVYDSVNLDPNIKTSIDISDVSNFNATALRCLYK